MTFASCGDPVQEFVRDVTSGRRFPTEGAYDDQQVRSQARIELDEIPIVHPDAAGIDIGAEEIFIAVPRIATSIRSVELAPSLET